MLQFGCITVLRHLAFTLHRKLFIANKFPDAFLPNGMPPISICILNGPPPAASSLGAGQTGGIPSSR